MSKAYKITLTLLVLFLALLTWLEANEPQPVNWTPSYAASDEIPLGTKVLFESLKEQEIQFEQVNVPPYEFLQDSTRTGTYLFLNDQLSIDQNELKKLLAWVEKGNTVFFIAESLSENLLDTFNLKTTSLVPEAGISSRPLINLTHPNLKSKEPFLYDRETYQVGFINNDSLSGEILGMTQLQENPEVVKRPEANFLRDSLGKGVVYIHLMPKAFSNYFLLDKNNHEYAERVLAYIPSQKRLFWDHYYKTGKTFNTSPLYIILNSKPLRWAYYFVIIGSIIFIIFEGKRKQRSIPVITPLRNHTLDFTRTIAGLYLDRKDYKAISSRKIALFLDHVRNHFRISTEQINDGFYQRLATISENSVEDVKALWQLMERLEKKNTVTREELLQLNKAIKAFKKT
ncbi:DUF4350 domain-containing protein [Salinimicrobium oceani]|uniref:DUF4350 domain-containing protein n=1 Tax=Salinimicrobium oceani TaxID=2722702 RepID=A0ABX1CYF5_9FLAO|nr:DUF4350 domain-containing protein [Salinimicrobium oceani]NJW52822.1 DUF4350 domain-containing protein [Salinimicrobium oceani]